MLLTPVKLIPLASHQKFAERRQKNKGKVERIHVKRPTFRGFLRFPAILFFVWNFCELLHASLKEAHNACTSVGKKTENSILGQA